MKYSHWLVGVNKIFYPKKRAGKQFGSGGVGTCNVPTHFFLIEPSSLRLRARRGCLLLCIYSEGYLRAVKTIGASGEYEFATAGSLPWDELFHFVHRRMRRSRLVRDRIELGRCLFIFLPFFFWSFIRLIWVYWGYCVQFDGSRFYVQI